METVLRFLRKLKFLFFRGQFNRELEEEMVFHREQVEKDLEPDVVYSDAASTAGFRSRGRPIQSLGPGPSRWPGRLAGRQEDPVL